MIIKKKGILYNYADDGETIVSAKVDYSSFDSPNNLNATVAISLDMVDGVESWDDVTPKMIDKAARIEIKKWLDETDDAPKGPVTVKEEAPTTDTIVTGNYEDGGATPTPAPTE